MLPTTSAGAPQKLIELGESWIVFCFDGKAKDGPLDVCHHFERKELAIEAARDASKYGPRYVVKCEGAFAMNYYRHKPNMP